MGADVSTIDLARDQAPVEIERAVDDANGIVSEDRPVSIRFVSQAEAATLSLRKASAREGTLRLVDISGFDLSACGGTHVERTGAIGVIVALSWERLRGGSRVTFACGGRALRMYRDAVAGGVRALSVLPGELPAAVDRVLVESPKASGRTSRACRRSWLRMRGHGWLRTPRRSGAFASSSSRLRDGMWRD